MSALFAPVDASTHENFIFSMPCTGTLDPAVFLFSFTLILCAVLRCPDNLVVVVKFVYSIHLGHHEELSSPFHFILLLVLALLLIRANRFDFMIQIEF